MQTAPTGFAEVGWKYYLVIICWSVFFIPVIYFFWPETAQLSLEEIGKNFGDEVAVHVNDASEEERQRLDQALEKTDVLKGGSVVNNSGGASAASVEQNGEQKV